MSGYTFNRLANDIRTVVGTLQLDNFTLAGHSTGGAMAIRYMARYYGYGVSNLSLLMLPLPQAFQQKRLINSIKKR